MTDFSVVGFTLNFRKFLSLEIPFYSSSRILRASLIKDYVVYNNIFLLHFIIMALNYSDRTNKHLR